jgi:putative transcriptional regulator
MKEKDFDELLASVQEGAKIIKGTEKPSRSFHFDDPKVASIRRRYKLSQSKFAAMMGISVGTLRNWEQGRRRPEGPARVLLNVIAKHPEAVLDTMGTSRRHKPPLNT